MIYFRVVGIRKGVFPQPAKGRRRKVLTYVASNEAIDESLKPYSLYKERARHLFPSPRE
jgi:hypothetical protein